MGGFSGKAKLRKDGGAEGVRTPDLLNAIQALYQLSYDPIRSEKNVRDLTQLSKRNILTFLLRLLAFCGEPEPAERYGTDRCPTWAGGG